MSVKLTRDGTPIEVKRFTFPGGETQVRLSVENTLSSGAVWVIEADIRNGDDIMALLLVNDAIRRIDGGPAVHLIIPYLPYARQDRAAYRGESFALHVFAQLLRAASFDRITTLDVHSKIAAEQIPGLRSIPAATFVKPVLSVGECVVSPDAGAVQRARECASDRNPLVQASKHRDPDTGLLTEPRLEDPLATDADAIVVDDICDGGATFLQLGKVLRQSTRGRLRLYVTHGIFSKGVDQLLDVYDEILCANLISADANVRGRVTVIKGA